MSRLFSCFHKQPKKSLPPLPKQPSRPTAQEPEIVQCQKCGKEFQKEENASFSEASQNPVRDGRTSDGSDKKRAASQNPIANSRGFYTENRNTPEGSRTLCSTCLGEPPIGDMKSVQNDQTLSTQFQSNNLSLSKTDAKAIYSNQGSLPSVFQKTGAGTKGRGQIKLMDSALPDQDGGDRESQMRSIRSPLERSEQDVNRSQSGYETPQSKRVQLPRNNKNFKTDSQKNYHQKFEFVQERYRLEQQIQMMSIGERRLYEKEQYEAVSKSKRGRLGEDSSLSYYVMDSSWVNQWVGFIEGENGLPPEIDNTYLINEIVRYRKLNPDYSNDDKFHLKKDKDFMEVTPQVWKFFLEAYGCKTQILVKYFYQQQEGILPSLFKDMANSSASSQQWKDLEGRQKSLIPEEQKRRNRDSFKEQELDRSGSNLTDYPAALTTKGKYFSAIMASPAYNYDVLRLSRQDRQKYESEQLARLQDIPQHRGDAVFVISGLWIAEWVKFTQPDNLSDSRVPSPPGCIDNFQLKQKLVIDGDLSLLRNKDYFMFSKQAWEFFFNIYGGGPVIIMNNHPRQPQDSFVDPKIEVQSMSSNFSKYGQSTATTSAYKEQNTINRSANKSQQPALTDGIVGIRNNSYYCYLNAFMQCLAPLEVMRDHYLSQTYARYKNVVTKKDNFDFSNGLYLFYKQAFRQTNRVIELKHIKDIVARKFHPIMQHDSHEFMIYLFDSLQDEETPTAGSQFNGSDPSKSLYQIVTEYEQSHPSMIDRMFGGMQKTIVSCGKCQSKSETYNPFMSISLAFEPTLDKCIQKYLKEDVLETEDMYKCEKCNLSSKASIKTELSKLPQVIIFHLKRFTYPQMKKIKGKCKYAPSIDMGRFCQSPLEHSLQYELFALTVHIGTLDSGHYIAYTKRNGRWYLFNDEDFEEVREEEALGQEAYLLFYKKITD